MVAGEGIRLSCHFAHGVDLLNLLSSRQLGVPDDFYARKTGKVWVTDNKSFIHNHLQRALQA